MSLSLLDRRLVIVSGKGGTGKTTVSAALALAGVRSGRRVLVAEVGRDESIPRLFGHPGKVGYDGKTLLPGLHAMRIDPFEALAEYLGLQVGLRSVVDAALRMPGFHELMKAAPGWRELITLGKVWHLEQMKHDDGSPLYDLLIVDAPATGHGVTFLDVPRVVRSAIRAGPLRRNSGLVEDMIRDQTQTLLLPVALGEELPARETLSLTLRAQRDVGIAVDRVVLNAMAPDPFEGRGRDLCAKLDALGDGAHLGSLPSPKVLSRCASHLVERHEMNERYAHEISAQSGLPAVRLPYLPSGLEDPDDLATLADALLATPQAVT